MKEASRDFFLNYSFGWLLGWLDAVRPRPQPDESILLVRSDTRPAFSHEVEKILFLFGRDLITWDVADSTLTGVEAVSLDRPSCAHLDLIIPVQTTLGAFSSEVVSLLFDRQFELVALLVIFYTGTGELLINDQ